MKGQGAYISIYILGNRGMLSRTVDRNNSRVTISYVLSADGTTYTNE